MLDEALEKFGFNEKERRVFQVLAESGRASAGTLSKRVHIPRATTYSVLSSLVEKGVVSEDHSSGTTVFIVNNPASFTRLVDEERSLLISKSEAAKEVERILGPVLKKSILSMPKLQFFEGKQNIEAMLYRYLPEWRESMARVGEHTLWGYQDPSFVEQYRKWHDYLWKTMSPKEKIRLFTNESNIEKDVHTVRRREVRTLPEGVQFVSSIWIYGEFIIMGSTREKPHYAFQLRDPIFGSNLRTIFELLWNLISSK